MDVIASQELEKPCFNLNSSGALQDESKSNNVGSTVGLRCHCVEGAHMGEQATVQVPVLLPNTQ